MKTKAKAKAPAPKGYERDDRSSTKPVVPLPNDRETMSTIPAKKKR